MKTLLKLAAMGGLVAVAINLYRWQQDWDRELPGSRGQRRGLDENRGQDADQPVAQPMAQVADTNSVTSGDPALEQSGAQPQDWRGAQNVLGQ